MALDEDFPEDPDEALGVLGGWLEQWRVREILSHADQVQRAYEARGDSPGQAMVHLVRGLALRGDGGGAAAREEIGRSVELLRSDGETLTSVLLLWTLARFDFTEGRMAAAEGWLEDALKVLQEFRHEDGPISIAGVDALQKVFAGMHGVGPALSRLPLELKDMPPAMHGLVRGLLADLFATVLQLTRVDFLMERGDLAEAETVLIQAEGQNRLISQLFTADVHQRWGRLHRRHWRLDAARERYLQALAKKTGGVGGHLAGSPRDSFPILEALAEIDSLRGHLDLALEWNEQAVERARAADLPSDEARFLAQRARFHMRSGRFDQARGELRRGLEVSANAEDEYRIADLQGLLGHLAMLRGDYEAAVRCLERSRMGFAALGESLVEAPTLLNLSQAYIMLGSHERTAELIERSMELMGETGVQQGLPLALALRSWNEQSLDGTDQSEEIARQLAALVDVLGDELGPDARRVLRYLPAAQQVGEVPIAVVSLLAAWSPPVGELYESAMRAALDLKDGSSRTALDDLTSVAEAFREQGNVDSASLYSTLAAIGRWRAGELEDGVAELDRAIADLETVLRRVQVGELRASFLGQDHRRLLYRLHVELLTAAGRHEDAFLQVERIRAGSLLQLLGNQRLGLPGAEDPESLRQAEGLRQQIGIWEEELASGVSAAVAARLRSDLAEARRRYADLRVRLKVQSEDYAALTQVDPATVAEIQAVLEPGVQMVRYFLGPQGAYAWVVDRDRFIPFRLDLDEEDLRSVTCRVRARGLGARGEGAGAAPREDSETRDERGGLRRTGCSGERVERRLYDRLIGPLRSHLTGHRLVVVPHGPLHYLAFASLLDDAGHRLVESYEITRLPSASVMLLLAGKESPVAGRALVLGNPRVEGASVRELPHAEVEAKRVADLLGADTLLGEEATESALYRRAPGVDLVHFAAHGRLLPASPRFSHVSLAADDDEDGRLEVQEVFAQLDLSGVNLVVLSACETGVGPDEGGDEIVSLTRSFLYAGTPGVISTLWPVDDAASALLMSRFYEHYRGGETAATALQRAQVAMIESGGRYADPYYWAGYILTGDPQGVWMAAAPTEAVRQGAAAEASHHTMVRGSQGGAVASQEAKDLTSMAIQAAARDAREAEGRESYEVAAAHWERVVQLTRSQGLDVAEIQALSKLEQAYFRMSLPAERIESLRRRRAALLREYLASPSADLLSAEHRSVLDFLDQFSEMLNPDKFAWDEGSADDLEKVFGWLASRAPKDEHRKFLGELRDLVRGEGEVAPILDSLADLAETPGDEATLRALLPIFTGSPVDPELFRSAADAASEEDLLQRAGMMRWLAGVFGLVKGLRTGKSDLGPAVAEMVQGAEPLERLVAETRTAALRAARSGGFEGRLLELQVDLLALAGKPEEAFQWSERLRARGLHHRDVGGTVAALSGAEPVTQQATVLELEGARATVQRLAKRIRGGAADPESLRTDLERARAVFEELELRQGVLRSGVDLGTGAGRESLQARDPQVDSLGMSELRAALPQGVALVNYFVGPVLLHVWVVDAEEVHHLILDETDALDSIPCKGLGEMESRVSETRGANPVNRGCLDETQLRRLDTLLIQPVLERTLAEKWLIVPHGPLHRLPFAAFLDRDRRPLVERVELAYLPAASLFPDLYRRESSVRGEALIFGAPATGDPRLEGLNHARAEAEWVSDLFGVTPHLGQAASEEGFYAEAPSRDLVHLAGHGIQSEASPRFNRVALAPSGEGLAPEEDGSLEIREVEALDLSEVNLVVLSACETGVGPNPGGDEIVSLSRAFLDAGVSGVISTLWPVDDAAAAFLMRSLYRHLLAGEAVSSALRRAQLDLAKSGGRYAAPRHWAAFILTGDPQARWSMPTPSAPPGIVDSQGSGAGP